MPVPESVWELIEKTPGQRRAEWRAAAFARDPYCPSCGREMHNDNVMDDARCTVDHVVAQAADGGDDPSNWALLCRKCNAQKRDLPADLFTCRLS